MMRSNTVLVSSVLLLAGAATLVAWLAGRPGENGEGPPVKSFLSPAAGSEPEAAPRVKKGIALEQQQQQPRIDTPTHDVARRLTIRSKSLAEDEELYARARQLGRRVIPAIMAEVRQHQKAQWWASRACNALEGLGVGAAADIAGYLGDPHEEVRVIASVSLFFMGRETKNDIPFQLLRRARQDKNQRVRYMAEMAWRTMNEHIGPELEVPKDFPGWKPPAAAVEDRKQ